MQKPLRDTEETVDGSVEKKPHSPIKNFITVPVVHPVQLESEVKSLHLWLGAMLKTWKTLLN